MLIAVRKEQPSASDVHVNRPLTNISIAYLQDQTKYVAARVFPVVPVLKQSNSYYRFSRADLLRVVAEKRAPGTESAGGGYTLDTDTYACHVYGFHKDVSEQARANTDNPLNPDRNATQLVTQACLTRRELTWASIYFTTGVWTGSTTGSDITPGTLWDVSTSTPIADIRAQIFAVLSKTGFKPNTLVLGAKTWQVLQDNPEVVDRIKAGQTPGGPAIVNLQTLAKTLELNRVMVAEAVYNSAAEGATESTGFILGNNDALLVYAAPAPDLEAPSAGYTFAWTGLFGAGQEGMRISRFPMIWLRSDRVEGEMAFDLKLVASELGVFFLNTTS